MMVKVAKVVKSEEAPLTKDPKKTYVVAYHGLHLAIPWELGGVGVVVDALFRQAFDVLSIYVRGTLIVWVGICLVETIHEVVTLLFEFHILVITLDLVIPLFFEYFLDVLLRRARIIIEKDHLHLLGRVRKHLGILHLGRAPHHPVLAVHLGVLCLIRALMGHPLRRFFEGIHDVFSEAAERNLLDPCPPLP